MARDRWTLALILICLPILATVITAFRIRDLPKSYDSSKLDTKKTQQCDDCDVKVSSKVHSVKIESDKHKYDDLKKTVREKQQPINEKVTDSKSAHRYNVKSDEDNDDDDDLELSKIQTGFRQEYPKDSKLDKSKLDLKPEISTKKMSFSVYKEDGDIDDEDDKDDDKHKSKLTLKAKISEVKKTPPEKPKLDVKRSQIKVTVKNPTAESREKNDDDDDDDDAGVILKPKLSELKQSLSEKSKYDIKGSQLKIAEVAHQTSDSSEVDDDEDDDDYEGLDNIDELFKILDMKPSAKLKSGDQNQKVKPPIDVKIPKTPKLSNNKDDKDDSDDDDNDDDDDDDDDDSSKTFQETKMKIIITKTPQLTPKDIKGKTEINVKKPLIKIKKDTIETEKSSEQEPSKPVKDKTPEILKKPTSKEEINDAKQDEKDSILKTSASEIKKPVSVKKESFDKTKVDEHTAKKSDKEKTGDIEKSQPVTKKEDKKELKDTKTIEDKGKTDPVKKTKDTEKQTVKPKTQEKDNQSSTHEDTKKVDKKPIHEPKKDQTEHKDIFKTTEHKKDIKYDFEKPNAYKDTQKSFDYSEFEKMQVSKSSHKENKRTEKASAEKFSDSREERYLKHVTEALNRRNLLKSEFEDFYAFFPTFAPNFSRIHNPECRRHGQILLRQLRGTKLWALNMLDATGKIPSGVLQGNGIQLGDFDQCLGSRARVQLDTGSVVKVQGKYCLARIDVKAEHTELEAPVYLAQAKNLIRSKIDDPGHFVPRFSTLSWGVCVPSACDREDVEVIIKDAVKHYQHKSGVVVKVKVDEDDCHTDEGDNWEVWLELPTVLTLSLYGVIVLLVIVATVLDFMDRKQSEENQEENGDEEGNGESKKQSDNFLSPFSLYRTVSKLIAPGTTDEISCIHGVRGIATIALLMAHKFMPIAVMPYTNRLKITEMASSPLLSWCRAGWVFTDCFLLLSGTLTAHRVASDTDTGAFRRLFSRYLRLTPALLAVILFYAFVWDKLSTGPMWGTFVTKNAEICERRWWWNLLYVQNYFGLEDMCAPQTHQLALDMQLTILGGVIVWFVQSGLGFSKLLLPAVHLIAAYFRYTTVRDHRLTMLAYHGVSVSQLYRTARLSYISTLHRCSPYLIGLSLGLALKKPSKHGKFLLTLGWLTSIGLFALVGWSGIDSGSTQYRYSVSFAAQYAAIAPLASSMAIAWVIYAVHCGTCGFLSRMFCWRPLVFISRLSYALYLCQFIIFITNIGTVRTSREFTLMSLIDLQEISAILLSSAILTVTFVIPMQSLHKMFSFEWKSDPEKSPERETKEPEPKADEVKIEEKKEPTLPTRNRHNLVAHREVLEEIPEAEVEYETQREITEGLDGIMEEEEEDEGTTGEEQIEDLEIIEDEEAGDEEAWLQEERPNSREDDQDLDEWEWTANGSGRTGAQYYRYAR